MPIENIGELRELIVREGLNWQVRELPADYRPFGLGWEPADPDDDARAVEIGSQLLAKARLEPEAIIRNTRLSLDHIRDILRLLPAKEFDWRDHGVIGPVRDQGQCGSCVSFACTGLVGAQAEIELGVDDLHLSEADSHFCSSHGASCGGWNNPSCLDQIRTRGVLTDASFPYANAFDSPPVFDANGLWMPHCHSSRLRWWHTYSITNYTAHTGDDRKTYLSSIGPLVCSFEVFEDFDNYGGGVFQHVTGNSRGWHAVLVVGYSDVDQAWICRNSWDPNQWGPSTALADGTGAGFFKIAYGNSGIDNNPMYGCRGVIAPHPLFDIRLDHQRILKDIDPGPVRFKYVRDFLRERNQ